METLIDHNVCDQAISQHLKKYHKANIIIKKKQTHVELIY